MLLAKKQGAETTNRLVWFLALVIAVITSIDSVLFFGLVNMLSVEQLTLLSFSAAILAAGLLITVAELTGQTKRGC
jgi:uncharacterized membrane protein